MVMLLAIVALCLSRSASANVPSSRGCPAVTTQSNFDVTRYLGTWYLNQQYTDDQFYDSNCTFVHYTGIENGSIDMLNHFLTKAGKPAVIRLNLSVPNPNDASKLKLRFPPFTPSGITRDYYVLATDYITYAVVYNCVERQGVGSRHIWILTREQNPSPEIIKHADTQLEKNNISRSILRNTGQTNCKNQIFRPNHD